MADDEPVRKVVKKAIKKASPVLHAEGASGQVHFDGDYVTITRRGWRARATIGKGEKRIPIGMVVSVQWKPAGVVVDGFIQFETAGLGGTRSAFGRQTSDAWEDENSVVFTRRHMAAFEQIRNAVEQAIATPSVPAAGPSAAQAPLVADELMKLAGLVQQGLLTQEEYEQQKARLLRG